MQDLPKTMYKGSRESFSTIEIRNYGAEALAKLEGYVELRDLLPFQELAKFSAGQQVVFVDKNLSPQIWTVIYSLPDELYRLKSNGFEFAGETLAKESELREATELELRDRKRR
ncbi:hypothetical protein [Acinetobacter sp. SEK570]|uniref:hypothetical protein n=1 Tax=unclassified Acinetobacter TaxID=196816 RepID=UPI0039A1FD1F